MSDTVIRGDDKNEVRFDLSQLNDFAKTLGKTHILKVGIQGAKNARKTGGISNAEVGAAHEFGSYIHKVPMRSFLRMPLHSKAPKILAEVAKHALDYLTKPNGMVGLLKSLGAECVGQISDAFQSRGFGTWAALRPNTVANKIQNNPQPLINTRQLSRSITAKVEKI